MEQPTSPSEKFEGWAIVEIMGHQRVAGYVSERAFGGVVLLEVTAPEVPETETTLEQDGYIDGHMLGKGSRIARGRPRLQTMVGAASVYRMTVCTEAQALEANPLVTRIVEKVERAPVQFLPSWETDHQPRKTYRDDEDEDPPSIGGR